MLVGLCKTRWSECDISYERFYLAIPFIEEALQIINGTHPEENQLSVYRDGWDSKTKQEASRYLHAVTKFEFIIGLVSLHRLLHPLVGITQTLRGRSTDVVKAFNKVRGCIEDMKNVKENIDDQFHRIYQQPKWLAKKLSVVGSSHPKKCFNTNASKQRSC